MPKTVLCETLLCTMRGIEIFQNQSYREISPMWGSLMRGLPVIQIYSLNVNKGLSYQIKYVISKFQKNKSNENSLKILFEKVLFLCIAHFLLKFLRQRISLFLSSLDAYLCNIISFSIFNSRIRSTSKKNANIFQF